MAMRLLTRCTHRYMKVQSRASHEASWWDGLRADIGTREVVGYGFNGEYAYLDRTDYPMPAIRWKNSTPDVMALKEKEKGDWKKLTLDEKKALYRASFRQTFAEFTAPTGEWKQHVGVVLLVISLGLSCFLFARWAIHGEQPESLSKENQIRIMRRMIRLNMGPVSGATAIYNQEKAKWEAKNGIKKED